MLLGIYVAIHSPMILQDLHHLTCLTPWCKCVYVRRHVCGLVKCVHVCLHESLHTFRYACPDHAQWNSLLPAPSYWRITLRHCRFRLHVGGGLCFRQRGEAAIDTIGRHKGGLVQCFSVDSTVRCIIQHGFIWGRKLIFACFSYK